MLLFWLRYLHCSLFYPFSIVHYYYTKSVGWQIKPCSMTVEGIKRVKFSLRHVCQIIFDSLHYSNANMLRTLNIAVNFIAIYEPDGGTIDKRTARRMNCHQLWGYWRKRVEKKLFTARNNFSFRKIDFSSHSNSHGDHLSHIKIDENFFLFFNKRL